MVLAQELKELAHRRKKEIPNEIAEGLISKARGYAKSYAERGYFCFQWDKHTKGRPWDVSSAIQSLVVEALKKEGFQIAHDDTMIGVSWQ